jgi:type IV pilus assembly protein PilC
MPKYEYRARDPQGKIVAGSLRAANEDRAKNLLASHKLVVVSLHPVESQSVWQRNVFGQGASMPDLILFFRQTASMIKAGVAILDAVKVISRQVHKQSFRRVLQEVAYDIEAGSSLSSAMSKHDKVFSLFVLGMVHTGEVSGRLSESLESLASHLDQDYAFLRKVKAAFTYPLFIIGVVILLTFILFAFVLPQLIVLFDDAGVDLPLPTRILIAITTFLQRYWIMLVVLLATVGVVFRSYVQTPEGRYSFSTFMLRIPGISTLLSKLYLARLTSVLHTLFSSDVPALDSLKLAKEAVGNKVYQRVLDDTVAAVKDGASISSLWKQEMDIPPMLTTMVEVGERSGTVEKSFAEASRFFKRDVESALDTITVLLEPILVIVLGIGVAIIVAAVLLPIYNLVLVI